MDKERNHTPTGIRIEGAYENDRNADSSELFKAIVREAFNVTDVIIAHHIVYVVTEKRGGYEYQIVEEIPSADALIFEHRIAQKIWGDKWRECLTRLALEPVTTRDKLLAYLFNNRPTNGETHEQVPTDTSGRAA